MSRQGVWQLRKLLVHYCDFGGSSRGTREFVERMLPAFQRDNPQVAVEAVVRRGSHPGLQADYLNTTGRHVDLRNQPAEEVLRQAVYLRSSLGRKASLQARWGGSRVAGGLLATGLAVAVPHNFDVVKQRVRSQTPSIQGPWSHEVQAALKRQAPPA